LRMMFIRSILSKSALCLSTQLLKMSKKLSKLVAHMDPISLGASSDQTTKLHFGCGPRILKGWVNIDLKYHSYKKYREYIDEKYYPEEIRGDKSDFHAFDVTQSVLPFADNSVDVIFHEDFLEHLDQKGQMLFLSETCRVLKAGGVHRVNTPDLCASMRANSNFGKGFVGVFVEEWEKHGHLNVLTPTMLEEMALMVGYSEVLFSDRDRSLSKDVPVEYRPSPREPHRVNIFADLVK